MATTDFNPRAIKSDNSVKTNKFSALTLVVCSLANPGKSKFIRNDINYALGKLPEEYFLLLTLFFEGYKYQEIADYLIIPVDVIKTRIHVARKQLKNLLNPYSHSVAQSA